MLGTQNLWLFLASGILLNLTPGQDTFYIVGRTLAQGRRAGLLSVLGISSGSVVHTCAAAFGLSAILATSAEAFLAVKFAGAGYLMWLGARMLASPAASTGHRVELSSGSGWAIYRAGMLTNVLNPKVAVFFLAFLPQFVAPSADSKILAFLFLGSLFICTGTIWCFVLVAGASAVSGRLRAKPAAGRALNRIAGLTFMGLGVKVAVSK